MPGHTLKKQRADNLPICIFPKGKKAGIRCASLTVLKIDGEDVKVCGYAGCGYNERPLY